MLGVGHKYTVTGGVSWPPFIWCGQLFPEQRPPYHLMTSIPYQELRAKATPLIGKVHILYQTADLVSLFCARLQLLGLFSLASQLK